MSSIVALQSYGFVGLNSRFQGLTLLSAQEKAENDFIQVLQAALHREIASRDNLKTEIQKCKAVIRSFLDSIEV